MLLVAVVLLLVAAGLLVTSLTFGDESWAWGSVAASGLAAVALALRGWRRRRAARAAADDAGDSDVAEVTDVTEAESASGGAHDHPAEPLADEADVDDAPEVGVPEQGGAPADQEAAPQADVDDEPDEEDTDAADVLVVCDLDDEVMVIDEHPRYHLSSCRRLRAGLPEPLPVSEARELGFTPCAGCTPDRVLTSRHRARR